MENDPKEQELIEAVRVARAHGDLSENAEYHAAREALALYRSRKKADVDAIREEERRKQAKAEENKDKVQHLLDQGLSLDLIKSGYPWLFK